MQIAPSCYWRLAAQVRNPALRSARSQCDEQLIPDVQRVWDANWQAYGADEVWLQINREDIRIACCTVERLMKHLSLRGVRRCKVVRTTVPERSIQDRTDTPPPLCKTKESVELATLQWVHWFNYTRLLGPIGYLPLSEAEANYYRQLKLQAESAVPT